MNKKNKKLTETLASVCENYTALRSHLDKVMQMKNESDHDQLSNLGKRKYEEEEEGYINTCGKSSIIGNNRGYNYDQGLSSPNKRPKEIRTSVSGVRVRVDPSDKSLVSSQNISSIILLSPVNAFKFHRKYYM